MTPPKITIAVPSLNQGGFLYEALASIFAQGVPVEVMLADGGSLDRTPAVIHEWSSRLTWWRSAPDAGQAAAINEAVARGHAPYVCWLNADDLLLDGGLAALLRVLEDDASVAAVYGKAWVLAADGRKLRRYRTWDFSEWWLRQRCFIAQPATLIRRDAWEAVGGLDEKLDMAFDYDLWWRLYRRFGAMRYVREFVAGTRMHAMTKTHRRRRTHYREAMHVVRRHAGGIPIKWRIAWPFRVTAWRLFSRMA